MFLHRHACFAGTIHLSANCDHKYQNSNEGSQALRRSFNAPRILGQTSCFLRNSLQHSLVQRRAWYTFSQIQTLWVIHYYRQQWNCFCSPLVLVTALGLHYTGKHEMNGERRDNQPFSVYVHKRIIIWLQFSTEEFLQLHY